MSNGRETLEVLFFGWVIGVQTSILYASIGLRRQINRRNRKHQVLLDAGVDPLTILSMDDER